MTMAEQVAFSLLAIIVMLNVGLIAADGWVDAEAPGKLDILPDANGLGPFTYGDLNITMNTASTYATCELGDWICNIVKGASSAIDSFTFGLPQFGALILWLVQILIEVVIGFHFAITNVSNQIPDANVRFLLTGVDAVMWVVWAYAWTFGVFKPAASIMRGGGG